MRSVVTGGAGFIGSHLCERLAERGPVLAVDDLSSGPSRVPLLEAAGVELEQQDIAGERAAAAVAAFSPEVVFNLAAQMDVRRSVSDPVEDARVNILGMLQMTEAAASAGARLINFSSGGAVYGDLPSERSGFTEEDTPYPESPYGVSKSVAALYLRVLGRIRDVAWVNLMPGNVYGPRQDPHGEAGVVAIFAGRMLRGERCVVFGDGSQTRDYIYVDDVVEAALLALSKGEGETLNIGTGVQTSVLELYRAMAALTGVEDDPEMAPERPGELMRVGLDVGKAERVLGFKARTSLQEGLRSTIDSFRQP